MPKERPKIPSEVFQHFIIIHVASLVPSTYIPPPFVGEAVNLVLGEFSWRIRFGDVRTMNSHDFHIGEIGTIFLGCRDGAALYTTISRNFLLFALFVATNSLQLTPENRAHFLRHYETVVEDGSRTTISVNEPSPEMLVVSSLTDTSCRVHVQLDSPLSRTCGEYLVLMDAYEVFFEPYWVHGSHDLTLKFQGEKAAKVYEDLQSNGLRVFSVATGALSFVEDLAEAYELFFHPTNGTVTLELFQQYMNVTWTTRPDPTPIFLDESLIHSGDVLIMTDLEGTSFFIHFVTGSHASHGALFLWFEDGLYVVESTMPVITRTPYRTWLASHFHDGYDVVFLPLREEYRRRFDEAKAREYFRSMEGLPYGYHNFLFAHVDRDDETDFPPPLSSETLIAYATIGDRVSHKWVATAILEGMSQRLKYYYGGLGPVGSMAELWDVCNRANITIRQLWSLPERDSWVYSDGPSRVCSVFAVDMLRAAGAIDGAIDIQATEFTPRLTTACISRRSDLYMLDIYDVRPEALPAVCAKRDPSLRWCHLCGHYQVDPPGVSSVPLYPRMNERCGALPLGYERLPEGC
ncbi:putative Tryptophan synthase alpha chain [Paratrimastix pyriformis]|uniref:Tryptophan synthase alpha chain n=1 Tax=Paratrimastix pyriformis TaxID=342808 RepID=A0ABQ8UI15_9EUKA|nr:putative Tryptophan synthase alpha chain [Paratrimastix pyriformis]